MLSHFSRVRLFATLWTVAHQAPLSMGFSRQEYWIGLPYPPPGAIPNPGIEPESPASPALQVDSLPTEPPGKPRERNLCIPPQRKLGRVGGLPAEPFHDLLFLEGGGDASDVG